MNQVKGLYEAIGCVSDGVLPLQKGQYIAIAKSR
jgi:hypothetical protein